MALRSSTARIPRPPPPAAALTSSGVPSRAASAASVASSSSSPAYPGTTGTPAASASRRASILSPSSFIARGGGPIHVMPGAQHRSANAGFSAR